MSKVPKGTRDSLPETEKLRQELIKEAEYYFKLYNATRMDTPCFEILSTLMEKYNNEENAKEIYVLENKNETGEKCALRYDLTVPFSRYVKTNNVEKMRRYQIGKVFRRDQPSAGRYREFYQCDYDCLGNNIEWMTDAETLILLSNILDSFKTKFNMPSYTIRVNSREILSDMITACDIDSKMFESVCTSIDKLDKLEWNIVSKELSEKGISESSIEKLKNILNSNVTDFKSLVKTESNKSFINPKTRDNLDKIFSFVGNIPVVLDLKIARGLNYYTGLIFEVRLENSNISIAGGGRYDKLCSSPCVGFSLGLDRILNYVSYKFENPTKVWVVSMKSENEEKLLVYKFQVVTKLREKGISSGTEMKTCSHKNSMNYALKSDIPYIIFLGDDELNNNTVSLKNVSKKSQIVGTLDEVFKYIE